MPLLPGKKNVGRNISELEHAAKHRPHDQIVAIAMRAAGYPPKKKKR